MDEAMGCGIEAHGEVCLPWRELPNLRLDPGSATLATHLKWSDEQTVLAGAAVHRAIVAAGWQERSFRDWGVIAAPRYLGRTRVAAACARYRRNTVRGFSPLIIPHQSLHSVAGTLTIALGIHGPDFGVGGGPDHVGEALLTGLSIARGGLAPGLWVVVTDLDPEPIPTAAGETETPTVGHAVALALTPADAIADLTLGLQVEGGVSGTSPIRVADLINFLQHGGTNAWRGAIDGIGSLTIQRRNPRTGGLHSGKFAGLGSGRAESAQRVRS